MGARPPSSLVTRDFRILFRLEADPQMSYEEIAAAVGINERHARRLVDGLEAVGYLSRTRSGRRNLYSVHRDAPVRDRHARCTLGEMIDAYRDGPAARSAG